MGRMELARTAPRRAPGKKILAVLVKLHHTGVPVAVGNIKVSVIVGAGAGESDIGGKIEMLIVSSLLPLDAQRHQHLSILIEFNDLLARSIGDKNVVIFIRTQAVRVVEHAFSPRAQEFALVIEHDQRVGVRASVEYKNFVARLVGCYG